MRTGLTSEERPAETSREAEKRAENTWAFIHHDSKTRVKTLFRRNWFPIFIQLHQIKEAQNMAILIHSVRLESFGPTYLPYMV